MSTIDYDNYWFADREINMQKTTTKTLNRLLKKSIKSEKLTELYKDHKELFDLDKLGDSDKILLMKSDYDSFSTLTIKKRAVLDYISLWCKHDDFIRNINLEKLNAAHHRMIARDAPEYFGTHKLAVDGLDAEALGYLVAHDSDKYKPVCMARLTKLKNKTEIRKLLKNCQSIIPELTASDIDAIALNAKEMILLLKHKEIKEGITYSDELMEWLDLQVTMDVLGGTATSTVYLKNARKKMKA